MTCNVNGHELLADVPGYEHHEFKLSHETIEDLEDIVTAGGGVISGATALLSQYGVISAIGGALSVAVVGICVAEVAVMSYRDQGCGVNLEVWWYQPAGSPPHPIHWISPQ